MGNAQERERCERCQRLFPVNQLRRQDGMLVCRRHYFKHSKEEWERLCDNTDTECTRRGFFGGRTG